MYVVLHVVLFCKVKQNKTRKRKKGVTCVHRNMIFAKISAQTSRTGAGIALALVSVSSSATNSAVKSYGHSGDTTRALSLCETPE